MTFIYQETGLLLVVLLLKSKIPFGLIFFHSLIPFTSALVVKLKDLLASARLRRLQERPMAKQWLIVLNAVFRFEIIKSINSEKKNLKAWVRARESAAIVIGRSFRWVAVGILD